MLVPALVLSLTAQASEIPAAAADLGPGLHVVVHETIDASPDAVWSHFADFAAISRWSAGIEASRPLAADEVPAGFLPAASAPVPGRVVTVDGDEQAHVLTEFDAAARTLTFRSADLPPVMAYAQNQHVLQATGDGRTEVTIDVYVVPRGPARLFKGLIAHKLEGYLSAYLGEARASIEGGAR